MATDRNNQSNQNQGGNQNRGNQNQGSDNRQQHDGNNQQQQSDQGRDDNWQPGEVGAVKDPQQDGRLKENRETGRTLGTTEHSAQAPNAKREDDDMNDRGNDDNRDR